MTPPTPQGVHVATDALRGDAQVWARQADALGHAAAQAHALALTRLEAGLYQVLIDPYTGLQRHVVARCGEGRTAMTGVADTLRAVADTYDGEDARHEHTLRNLY